MTCCTYIFEFAHKFFSYKLRLPRSSIIIYNENCSIFNVITSILNFARKRAYRPQWQCTLSSAGVYLCPSCILHTVNFFSVFNIFIIFFVSKNASPNRRAKLPRNSRNQTNNDFILTFDCSKNKKILS